MLMKCVNGVNVPMSAEEEAATLTEWEAAATITLDQRKTIRAESVVNRCVKTRAVIDVMYPLLPDPKPTKSDLILAIKARVKELI